MIICTLNKTYVLNNKNRKENVTNMYDRYNQL